MRLAVDNRPGTGVWDETRYDRPPAVTDDGSKNPAYAVGSMWFEATTRRVWTCVDATVGAAQWSPDTLHPGFRAGVMYGTDTGNSATGSAYPSNLNVAGPSPPAKCTLIAVGLPLEHGRSISSLKVRCSSGSSGVIKGAIYANQWDRSASDYARPTSSPLAACNIAVSAVTGELELNLTPVRFFPRSFYWLTLMCDSASQFYAKGTNDNTQSVYLGRSIWNGNTPVACIQTPVACGDGPSITLTSMPDLTNAVWTEYFSTGVPHIALI